MWRHPYLRCSLLDQQAEGRGEKKVHFDIFRMVGNVYAKKQKDKFHLPRVWKDEIQGIFVQVKYNNDLKVFNCK